MTEELRYRTKRLLFSIRKYYGKFTPGNLVFNRNLQEFEQQVSSICSLVANGEIAPEDACEEIEKFWQELKHSKKELLDKGKFPTD